MGLDGVVRRRRSWVLAAWLVLLIASVPLAMRQSEHLSSGGFGVPGSQSQAVADAVATMPGVERTSLSIVLIGSEHVTSEIRAEAAKVDRVTGVGTPATKGEVTLIPLRVNASDDDATDVAVDLREALGVGSNGVHLAGQGALWAGLQEVSKHDLEKAEQTGFPIVLLILLAVFGSLAAAALPLALGLGSVLVTGALIWLVSQQMEMSVFVTNMASMIGIGVAVDYSLFVLARFREEVAAGHPRTRRVRGRWPPPDWRCSSPA